jgi:hypothetical protein
MKRRLLFAGLCVLLAFAGCQKSPDLLLSDGDGGTGTIDSTGSDQGSRDIDVNEWRFTEGDHTYGGFLVLDGPTLNTYLQGNNTYTFALLGAESNTGFIFNIVLSLADLDFTNKDYQSGISGNDELNAFYYSATMLGDNTYKSSNLDPGPVMDYKITAFDAENDVVTITFSGKVQMMNGDYTDISDGIVKAKIDRF